MTSRFDDLTITDGATSRNYTPPNVANESTKKGFTGQAKAANIRIQQSPAQQSHVLDNQIGQIVYSATE
jgi:hypothetical protein